MPKRLPPSTTLPAPGKPPSPPLLNWTGPGLTGGTAAAGSDLTYAPGNGTTSGVNVMFIDTSGVLLNDYYTSSGWQGPGPRPSTC